VVARNAEAGGDRLADFRRRLGGNSEIKKVEVRVDAGHGGLPGSTINRVPSAGFFGRVTGLTPSPEGTRLSPAR
jgi:hypothetical protein